MVRVVVALAQVSILFQLVQRIQLVDHVLAACQQLLDLGLVSDVLVLDERLVESSAKVVEAERIISAVIQELQKRERET